METNVIIILVGMALAIVVIGLMEYRDDKKAWERCRKKEFNGTEEDFTKLIRGQMQKDDDINVIVDGEKHIVLENERSGEQVLISEKGCFWREKSTDDWHPIDGHINIDGSVTLGDVKDGER